ncbi:hypothetical protein B0T14DRAFT_571927 [Immersiella caudata]|uniref:Uncharacterized protein n=1 Tax=Immersiella caudata TaxID=314043 RepID=A0AA39U475_9PEZI|nr:hypothetical protein B0T14DRAFT_571927 [Immersiella caudata]
MSQRELQNPQAETTPENTRAFASLVPVLRSLEELTKRWVVSALPSLTGISQTTGLRFTLLAVSFQIHMICREFQCVDYIVLFMNRFPVVLTLWADDPCGHLTALRDLGAQEQQDGVYVNILRSVRRCHSQIKRRVRVVDKEMGAYKRNQDSIESMISAVCKAISQR